MYNKNYNLGWRNLQELILSSALPGVAVAMDAPSQSPDVRNFSVLVLGNFHIRNVLHHIVVILGVWLIGISIITDKHFNNALEWFLIYLSSILVVPTIGWFWGSLVISSHWIACICLSFSTLLHADRDNRSSSLVWLGRHNSNIGSNLFCHRNSSNVYH